MKQNKPSKISKRKLKLGITDSTRRMSSTSHVTMYANVVKSKHIKSSVSTNESNLAMHL